MIECVFLKNPLVSSERAAKITLIRAWAEEYFDDSEGYENEYADEE